MEENRDLKGVKGFVGRLTLGITQVLESLPGVMDVRFVDCEPAEKRCLSSWEQKNSCILPEDLRDFYLTTNGFTLSWSSKLESEPVPLGFMVINSIEKLCQPRQSGVFSLPSAPTLSDLDCEEELQGSEDHPREPRFAACSRIFELDPCNGNGRVCLVYKNCSPGVLAEQSEVWFLDRSLFWHYLTSSFTAYYRLMITHLGLPEWQYTFTPYGPSPQAKCDPHVDLTGESPLNKLDPARAFRGKAKQPIAKKKPPSQGGGGGGGGGGGAQKGHGGSGRHGGSKR